jgi:hypothetical protein
LKENDIVFWEILEELKILSQGPWIEADGGIHPFGIQIRKILKHSITAGRDLPPLNEEKGFHTKSLSMMESM